MARLSLDHFPKACEGVLLPPTRFYFYTIAMILTAALWPSAEPRPFYTWCALGIAVAEAAYWLMRRLRGKRSEET
jgi:hypothetical protein